MSIENPSAFPFQASSGGDMHEPGYGMTLRDWFAGQALSAVARMIDGDGAEDWNEAGSAEIAYRFADAMIAARAHQSAHFNDGDL